HRARSLAGGLREARGVERRGARERALSQRAACVGAYHRRGDGVRLMRQSVRAEKQRPSQRNDLRDKPGDGVQQHPAARRFTDVAGAADAARARAVALAYWLAGRVTTLTVAEWWLLGLVALCYCYFLAPANTNSVSRYDMIWALSHGSA